MSDKCKAGVGIPLRRKVSAGDHQQEGNRYRQDIRGQMYGAAAGRGPVGRDPALSRGFQLIILLLINPCDDYVETSNSLIKIYAGVYCLLLVKVMTMASSIYPERLERAQIPAEGLPRSDRVQPFPQPRTRPCRHASSSQTARHVAHLVIRVRQPPLSPLDCIKYAFIGLPEAEVSDRTHMRDDRPRSLRRNALQRGRPSGCRSSLPTCKNWLLQLLCVSLICVVLIPATAACWGTWRRDIG